MKSCPTFVCPPSSPTFLSYRANILRFPMPLEAETNNLWHTTNQSKLKFFFALACGFWRCAKFNENKIKCCLLELLGLESPSVTLGGLLCSLTWPNNSFRCAWTMRIFTGALCVYVTYVFCQQTAVHFTIFIDFALLYDPAGNKQHTPYPFLPLAWLIVTAQSAVNAA